MRRARLSRRRCPIDWGYINRVHQWGVRGPVPVRPSLCARQEASAFLRHGRLCILDRRHRDLEQHVLEIAIETV